MDDLEKIDKENKSSRAANLGLGSNEDGNKELDETIKSFPFEKMIIDNLFIKCIKILIWTIKSASGPLESYSTW